jgi:integrase
MAIQSASNPLDWMAIYRPGVRGHVREKGPGAWELVVYLGRDPLTGRKRQRSQTVRGGRRDAERALAKLVGAVYDGRIAVGAPAATLDELLDRWLDLAADDLSPSTLREHRRIVKTRISPALGRVPITKLTSARLDSFYLALGRDGELSPASVARIHAVIRRALHQAVKWGWITANPATNATPPPVRHRQGKLLVLTDLHGLLDEAARTDPHLALFLRISATTGMRRGEVCGLQWGDLHRVSGTLTITRAVVSVPNGTVVKDTKTHAVRRLALDDETLVQLIELRTRRDDDLGRLGLPMLAPESFVFSHEPLGTTPWHPDTATHAFRRLTRTLGLTGVRLHDLRHLHATQLLAAGVPIRTVSGRLGHAQTSTTLNVYAHALEASDREAAETFRRLIDEQPRHGRPSV